MIRKICRQIKTSQLLVIAVLLLLGVAVVSKPAQVHASTTCPTDTSRGEVTGNFSVVGATGTNSYVAYVRMLASSSSNNTVVLEVDGTCYNIGGSSVPVYSGSGSSVSWANDSSDWIDSESGSTTPVAISLSTSSHSYALIGNADSVLVDRVLFVQADSNGNPICTPSGTGTNCATNVVAAPSVSVTAPANNATVTGASVPISVTATGDPNDTADTIKTVTIKVDGTQVGSPFSPGTGTTESPGNSIIPTNATQIIDSGSNTWTVSGGKVYRNGTATCSSNVSELAYVGGIVYQENTSGGWWEWNNGNNTTGYSYANGTDPCTVSSPSWNNQLSSGPTISATTYSPTYTWNTTGYSNGTHTITAVAVDSQNQSTTSSSITVTVSNAASCTTETVNPPTLTATPDGTNPYTQNDLSWTAGSHSNSACSVGGYNIYRNGTLIQTINNGSTTTYHDTYAQGFTAGTTTTYKISEFDSASPVDTSSQATATAIAPADTEAPNYPTLTSPLTVNSASSISLNWSSVTDNPSPGGTGVAGYNIYQADGKNDFGVTPINDTPISGTSYTVNGLTADSGYSYEVTAVDNAGNESAPSNIVTATTDGATCTGNPTAPGKPSFSSSTINSITLAWTGSTAASGCTMASGGYTIYRTDLGSSSLHFVADTGASSYSYTNTGLIPSTSYTYYIVASDASGHNTTGSTSNNMTTAADTAPSPPASVTATPNAQGSPTQVVVTWTASPSGTTTGYKIYCTSGGTTVLLTSSPVGTSPLSYTDQSALASTTYTYKVSAVDQYGTESAQTAATSVTTPSTTAQAPNPPTSITAPVKTTQSVQLNWTASSTSGISGYNIYLRINGTDVLAGTTSSTNFTYQPSSSDCLEPGITYTFDLKAVSNGIESTAASDQITTLTTGAYQGDINCNLKVDFGDLAIMARNWRAAGTYLPWQGDINSSGTVDFSDLQILATNWGKSW